MPLHSPYKPVGFVRLQKLRFCTQIYDLPGFEVQANRRFAYKPVAATLANYGVTL